MSFPPTFVGAQLPGDDENRWHAAPCLKASPGTWQCLGESGCHQHLAGGGRDAVNVPHRTGWPHDGMI